MRKTRFGVVFSFVAVPFWACSPTADPSVSPDGHESVARSTSEPLGAASGPACRMPSVGVPPGPDLSKSIHEPLAPSITINFHLIGLTQPSPVTDSQVHTQVAVLNQRYQGRAHFTLGEITRNLTSDVTWYWDSALCTNDGPRPLPGDLAPLHSGRKDVAEVFVRGGEGGCSYFPWFSGVGGTRDYTYIPEYPVQGGSGGGFYITHEIGHWLGLWHTHQNGCSAPGDEVDDTPYERDPSFDCPSGRDTCPGGGPDPVRNFMDHGENCASEFTQGQFARVESLWYLRDEPDPEEENDSKFLGWHPPPDQMQPLQTAAVWVRYRNTGTTTWTSGANYALGSQSPPNNDYWGMMRVALPHDVPPQTEVTFNFTATAPQNPARYDFRWRMVQDATAEPWFGEHSFLKTIEVGGGGPCPPTQAPTAVAPQHFGTDPTPTFSWTPVPGATGYTLYVQYKDGEFVIPGVLGWPYTTYTHPTPLPVGDNLIWKVRGVCNGVGGPYSNVPDFHILFGDVPLAHPARSFIERLYARPRYISENCGFDGGGLLNFCPTNALLRKNAARWLLKAKYGPAYVPPAATGIFLDVPPNDEFAPWIEELHRLGITAGCGGGNFCPNSPLTRGQAAVLLLLTKFGSGYRPPACFMQMWDDLPCSAPFADWVYDLVWRSIGVLGCDNVNFCANAPLTRADASSWLHKLFFGN